jgi:hypothetical protein
VLPATAEIGWKADLALGRKPFSITVDVAQTLRGYTRLEQLATSRAHIVPGHDPLVPVRYPPWKPQTQGRVHRLDVPRLT